MRVVITGAHGFLGWHLSCLLRAVHGIEAWRLSRQEFEDESLLAEAVADADVVFHLAGVNRADSDDEVERGNVTLADRLLSALTGSRAHVVYANSIHAGTDTPYGRGKRRAHDRLASSARSVADVWLPNLFGEHGRPAYNSFIATFCHEIANGRRPSVTGDRRVPLLHAQAAARSLVAAGEHRQSHQDRPVGQEIGVRNVLDRLDGFDRLYRERGEVPDIRDHFDRDLFNTFRSFLFPFQFPIHPMAHNDPRGTLVETSRSHGGTGQTFVSTTHPGKVRGDHYHLHKIERFFVVAGQGEIQLRRLFEQDVVTFNLTGEQPGFVDMPTMWVHNIRNTGQDDLVTSFWADQLLDHENPDQYAERVNLKEI